MSSLQSEKESVSFAESFQVKSKSIGESIEKYLAGTHPEVLLTLNESWGHSGPRETNQYGFVAENEKSRRWNKWYLRHAFGEKPRSLIAMLWFASKEHGANPKEWVMELYGRERLESFKKLAELLAQEFHVKIHLRLQSEHPRNSFSGNGSSYYTDD
ncbi:MAG TPA: hypothetical protein VHD55_04025 [Candidatus Paceibacterota bacterium]|nr:hypothetical protein [Candidatus Paceibacterota bacterium]